MRFWFIFAAMMGPEFFRRFIILFAFGMVLMLYSAGSVLNGAPDFVH